MPPRISLAPYILKSRTLSKWVKPLAAWYVNLSGYRKFGFKYDDLVQEENEPVQKALTRLTARERYDRAYRIKRASQATVLHKELPPSQWTKKSEDVRYLAPHVAKVMAEEEERVKWDNLSVVRKSK